ncbi:MAG: TldD/PmbA family protein, partial [Acidobacteriota bacterium]|nr:TldD/PmbA family protein [Acidobacteriota bacterium]
ERRKLARAIPGQTSVVFAPGTGGILIHELVGHGLEADIVLRRSSSLAAGSATGSDEVTVVDDPRRGRAAWRWDDEGVESRAVSLVERGRVVAYLSDLATAGRAGIAASGHGRRSSYRERVLPRMGCTFLVPGSRSPEEIVRETSRGVLVRRMESASVDPLAGRAVFRVTDADLLDQGRPGSALYPFLLEIDLDRGISSLDRVGNDLEFDRCIGSCLRDGQPLSTSVGAPTCRIGVATGVL